MTVGNTSPAADDTKSQFLTTNTMIKTRSWAWVKAGDEWVGTNTVLFLNVEEGPRGEDIMTFEYEGMTWTSLIVTGSRPG